MNNLVYKHFIFSSIFLIFGLLFGTIYSVQMLGYFVDNYGLLAPQTTRSLHLSLMLYGFVPLMLSVLPFALFEKEGIKSKEGLIYLDTFFKVWYIFLIFMGLTILFGVQRHLPFYDFHYLLNFILVAAGLFYLLAINSFIKNISVVPIWVRISKKIIIFSPFLLIILMNPIFGQVDKTLVGPHGDNTLGMSFALLPIYYLAIKLNSQNEFFGRKRNIFWIIPLFGYILSVIYRITVGNLSYNQEWFLQYLTLLYLPLLLLWVKDAKLTWQKDTALITSLVAFAFADVEGNILFIPEIRALFHRNDLVVAHAHIAVSLSLFLLSISIVQSFIDSSRLKKFVVYWTIIFCLMIVVLSVSGLSQAGLFNLSTEPLWTIRSISGVLALGLLLWFVAPIKQIFKIDLLRFYNLSGFFSDTFGGIMLLLFGTQIFSIIGIYEINPILNVVYIFMIMVGIIHLIGFLNKQYEALCANITSWTRIGVSAVFISLYLQNSIDITGLLVAIYDFLFAIFWLSFLALRFKMEEI
ncbi:MAG: hypothetical protein HY307_01760 [Arcobacter sp.]|nr:hypothetical protein [Arcobacter sp.]